MRVSTRLRRRSAVLALAAVAVLAMGAVRPAAHSAHHTTTSARTALLSPYEGVAAVTPAVLRTDAASDRVPKPARAAVVTTPGALAGLVLLAWLLVSLPWSGTALGGTGRLPGRRSPPLALS